MAKFDITSLTLSENAAIEDFAGESLASLSDPKALTSKVLIGLGYVIKKRENPEFTFEDAGNLTMSQITELIGGDDEDAASKN
jgi:hypothetical protein